jgi:hypothetical protein
MGQAEFARAYGHAAATYRKNENGVNEAGICLAGSFVQAGINANWLLTGEGPMLLADLKAPAPPGSFDSARMHLAIEAVEEGLIAVKRVMEPAKKADLVLAVYDLLEDASEASKGKVLTLVKLAA